MSTTNFQSQEEFEAYLDELGAQYHYSCFRENNGSICHQLGDWFMVKKMYDKALAQYKMTCETYRFPRSCYKFGVGFLSGEEGVEKSPEKALKYCQEACELGEPDGCRISASLLKEFGRTVEALHLFEKYCDMGHQMSNKGCNQASIIYITGDKKASIAKDMKKAFEFAVKGCELGSARACVNVSIMYSRGEGVAKDADLATKYREKAKDMVNVTLPEEHPFR